MITEKIQTPEPAALKMRVLALKGRLPANVRGLVLARFPELDTVKWGYRIHNVLNGSAADLPITEYLESLVA